uniref:AAA domain-containing protein n=1 Tax=Heterorhabditis bacteriophora TaxID=37862 RepID=A0A1I7XDU5_HETBA
MRPVNAYTTKQTTEYMDCAGYIIEDNFSDDNILRKYGLSRGLSLNESAVIMNGVKNPNEAGSRDLGMNQERHSKFFRFYLALFLHRNNSFLSELPFNVISFTDDEINRERAAYFVMTIKSTVAASNFHTYSCKTKGFNNPHQKIIVLTDLEPMINIVKEFVETKLQMFSYSARALVPTRKKILKHYQNSISTFLDENMAELESKCSTPGLVQLVGSYGSGKTTLLSRLVGRKERNYSFIIARRGMTAAEIQQIILDDIGAKDLDYISTLSKMSHKLLITIDNADLLERSDINAILSSSFHCTTVVLAMRKPMTSIQHRLNIVTIPPISEVQAIKCLQEIIAVYADTANLNKIELSSSQTSKELARKIVKFDTEGVKKSIENVEEGKEESIWTVEKCKIIGSLVRFGVSDEKAKALATLNTVSVCEAELSLLEIEARGHLLIACLCFLTIVDSGLTEPELRYLLAPENKILPAGIKRKFRNLPFGENLTCFSSNILMNNIF